MNTGLENIRQKLLLVPLPGKRAQFLMAPAGRREAAVDSYLDAAVSIMLYERGGELHFPLIKRTHNRHDRHRGQISLPGGRFDNDDKDLYGCAIRELGEELGIDTTGVERLGRLSRIFIPVSRFRVQPYVVFWDKNTDFKAQKGEVEYILEVKLKDLLDEQNVKTGIVEGYGEGEVPYFLLNGHKVWGATAMILSEFKHLILSK